MIITTIDQVRETLTNLTKELTYIEFKPHLESAEHWIKNEILGADIYDGIVDEDITDADLLRLVKKVIILKAYDIGIPSMDLIHTSSGFGVVSDKNIAPASRQRVDRMISQNRKQLAEETEWLIDYLEATDTFHTDWKASPAYSLLSDCLIQTAREFSRYSQHIDRMAYLKMKHIILRVQEDRLAKNISQDFVDELLTQVKEGTLSSENTVVLPKVKKALALASVAEGLDAMVIILDETGVLRSYEIGKTSYINEVMLNSTTRKYKNLADQAMADLQTFLDDNIDDYETYADSDEKTTKDDVGYENEEDDSIFVFKGGM